MAGETPAAQSATASSALAPPSGVERQCRAWLAIDTELDRLTPAWQVENHRLAELPGWSQTLEADHRARPAAQALFELGDQIERLFAERWALLEALEHQPAAGFQDVAAKLAVAARAIQPDKPFGHELLAIAVAELPHQACPHCGARLLDELLR